MIATMILAAAVVALPAPPGPSGVGTRTFSFTDSARGREVVVQLFYPARPAAGAAPAPYFPDVTLVADQVRAAGGRAAKAADGLAALAGVRAHAVEGAPYPPGTEKFPVVLFSPGGNMSRHFYTVLAEGLASHGYAVAVMSHPGSGLDVFSGKVLFSEPRWNPPKDADDAARDAFFEELSGVLAADAAFALDKLATLDAAVLARLDLEHVALAGHSRGGKTVSRLCLTDARCKAAVIFDNLPPASDRARGPRVPVLFVRSEGWEEGDLSALQKLVAAAKVPVYDAVVTGAEHMSFSDAGLTDPARFKADLPAARGLAVAGELMRAFLDKHLRGKETRFPPPGLPEAKVTVTAGR